MVWVERFGIVGRSVAGVFCGAFSYENIAAQINGEAGKLFS